MSRYYIQGEGEVHLSRNEFQAQGGEGSIYVKGSTAYKLYRDPSRMISPAKIRELSLLTRPHIIRPLKILLDANNTPAGYSMRQVKDAYALCQMFPRAFRQRKNLTPEGTLHLVRRLQDGVQYIHSKAILIVDLNEMNFLVSDDLREIFFIDVDSYQRPSFPATAIMESVRDRHTRGFSQLTDWFSFAILSFQMFTGIHPFKGTYKPLENIKDQAARLDARMRANISVLHEGVHVPASCLPFNVIPQSYLDWYRNVFEEGARTPPPQSAQAVLTLVTTHRASETAESSLFEAMLLREFDSEIIAHDSLITTTQQSIYFNDRQFTHALGEARAIATPRHQHLILVEKETFNNLSFHDLTTGLNLKTDLQAEAMMLNDNRLYLKRRTELLEVDFREMPGGRIIPCAKVIANVSQHATQMFDGVLFQNLLGAYYASIPSAAGICHQVRLPELDDYRIVDAWLERNMLMLLGTRAGQYDKLIFRFAKDFQSYDVRSVMNVSATEINFTVLDSGLCLHLNDNDDLEIFSRQMHASAIKIISDPFLRTGSARLFHTGSQALLARGPQLYKFSLRQQLD